MPTGARVTRSMYIILTLVLLLVQGATAQKPTGLQVVRYPSVTDSVHLLDPQPQVGLIGAQGQRVGLPEDLSWPLYVAVDLKLPTASTKVAILQSDGMAYFNDIKVVGWHGTEHQLLFYSLNSSELPIKSVEAPAISVDVCGSASNEMVTGKGMVCVPCPEGVSCKGDLYPALPGYWTPNASSGLVLKCPTYEPGLLGTEGRASHCTGTENGVCEDGYAGPLCTECGQEYGQTYFQWCTRCRPKESSMVILIVIAVAFAFVMSFMIVASLQLDDQHNFVAVFRMLLTHLQMTSRISLIALGLYPQLLERFFSIARFASEFTLEVSFTWCGFHWRKPEKFLAYMIMPGVITILPVFYIWLYQLIPDKTPQENFPYDQATAADPDREIKHKMSYRARYQKVFHLGHTGMACFYAAALLMYPTVLLEAGSWLQCESPLVHMPASNDEWAPSEEPGTWLMSDPRIHCTDPQYQAFRMGALIVIFLYGVGFLVWPPLTMMVVKTGVGEKAAFSLFSYCAGAYRPHCWWWESAITLRKALIQAVILALVSIRMRIYLSLLVLGGSFVLQIMIWPFSEPKYNKLEWMSLLSTITTLGLGLFLLEDIVPTELRVVITIAIFVIQCSAFLYFFYFAFRLATQALHAKMAPQSPVENPNPDAYLNDPVEEFPSLCIPIAHTYGRTADRKL